ncbi:hypothetical protein HanXRQr2_Chr06g0255391 [Helianthus annuus]|uniref:Uncharacterized protein n=1 Tax=Helianthus annuus TaxID=4232 RepID=A0A9K3NJQ5_HELAN|nr:hypothetical protein HanXRQr2_Chr06g0255391 [Helianthus annuus]KAJ0915141.1 hypothetical protein HanPSC8_Chr06g0246551 [Helianthus annuus]
MFPNASHPLLPFCLFFILSFNYYNFYYYHKLNQPTYISSINLEPKTTKRVDLVS